METRERIKSLMKEKGYSQKELALKSNVTEASMSKYLSGERNPRTDVLVKIAKALDVSVDFLVDDQPSPDKPYEFISTALARCKNELSNEEKKKIIKFLLED